MMRALSGWKYPLVLFTLAALVWMVMDFNTRSSDLRRLTASKAQAATRVRGLERTRTALEAQMAYARSDAAVIAWAYQDAHMSRSGDQVVVLIPGAKLTPTPVSRPLVTPVYATNWQRWMTLLMGPQTP